MIRRMLSASLVLSFLLALCFGGANAAMASSGAPTATLLTTFNAIGFGSTLGPDGMLYVTDPQHGQVLRVNPTTGAYTTFASGLPPMPDGWTDGGAFDVTFIGNTAYVLVSEVDRDATGSGNDVDGIYRVDGQNKFKIIANIGKWSKQHLPPTPYVLDTGVQFAFQPYGEGFIVNDAHHNRTLYVTLNGMITQLIQFGDVVPTGLARSGTSIYMAQAGPLIEGTNGQPNKEIGQVVKFDVNTLNPVELAGGIPLPIDVEFGADGALYTLSQGTHRINSGDGSPADPNTGALLRINSDHTTTTVISRLNLPTSVKFIGNTAYVICFTGEIWKIDNLTSR